MKIQFLAPIALVAFAVGCAGPFEPAGAAVDTDKNVLTGGPITGTTIQELPEAVKSTLKQSAPQAEIADIDKATRDGREVFEISFTQPGKNPRLLISQDGTVLPDSNSEAGTRLETAK